MVEVGNTSGGVLKAEVLGLAVIFPVVVTVEAPQAVKVLEVDEV